MAMTNSSSAAKNSSEESGWTAYLQDFSCNNESFMSGASSLQSDAAWNGPDGMRRLTLNKLKKSHNRRKYDVDDDLEDTASSPLNSPKVSTMKEMEVNHRRIDNNVACCDFLSSSNNFFKQDREERNADNDKSIHQFMELRKRGLCLVPMSVFINYIG